MNLGEMSVEERRRVIVSTARECVGMPRELERGFCYPFDSLVYAEQMMRHQSRCALVALGIMRALGVDHPVLREPYASNVGKAVAWVVRIGNDLRCMADVGEVYPGDILVIGSVRGEHVLTVVGVDGDEVRSVDGGTGRIREVARAMHDRKLIDRVMGARRINYRLALAESTAWSEVSG